MESFLGLFPTKPGSTSNLSNKSKGSGPIGFNHLGNTYKQTEVSPEKSMGAAGTKFL